MGFLFSQHPGSVRKQANIQIVGPAFVIQRQGIGRLLAAVNWRTHQKRTVESSWNIHILAQYVPWHDKLIRTYIPLDTAISASIRDMSWNHGYFRRSSLDEEGMWAGLLTSWGCGGVAGKGLEVFLSIPKRNKNKTFGFLLMSLLLVLKKIFATVTKKR